MMGSYKVYQQASAGNYRLVGEFPASGPKQAAIKARKQSHHPSPHFRVVSVQNRTGRRLGAPREFELEMAENTSPCTRTPPKPLLDASGMKRG